MHTTSSPPSMISRNASPKAPEEGAAVVGHSLLARSKNSRMDMALSAYGSIPKWKKNGITLVPNALTSRSSSGDKSQLVSVTIRTPMKSPPIRTCCPIRIPVMAGVAPKGCVPFSQCAISWAKARLRDRHSSFRLEPIVPALRPL
jgi:hypothetical protein